MTFTVIVEADAERDWQEAATFYDQREPEVRQRFNVAVRQMLHTLSRDPKRFEPATSLTHKAKMPPPWPHSIYFTINNQSREVNILAIWHGARNPAELRQRLK